MNRIVLALLAAAIPFLSVAADIKIGPGITIFDSVPAAPVRVTAHVRAASESRAPHSWGLVWGCTDSLNYLQARLLFPSANDVSEIYTAEVPVEISRVSDGRRQVISTVKVAGNIDPGQAFNSLKLVCDAYSARLYAGRGHQRLVCQVPFSPGALGVVTDSPIVCRRMDATVRCVDDLGTVPVPDASVYGAPAPAGVYEYMDRDIDPSLVSLGGAYRVAVVPSDDGTCTLVYLSGASVNPGDWSPGKVKAVLKPTPFSGNYDMVWLDAQGRLLSEDVNAQFSDDGMVLTLRFPLLSSQIRLRRVGDP